MWYIPSGEDALKPRLGPTVFAPVKVNGITTDALVDTRSPAMIISLGFVLKVLVKLRPQNQTDEQWCDAIWKKFQEPDVALSSCGGHRLDFIVQIQLSLSQGDQQIKTIVLMKKDAPNNLFIGTDVQPKLGFALVIKKPNGGAADLLSGEKVTPLQDSQTPQPAPEQNQEGLTLSQ